MEAPPPHDVAPAKKSFVHGPSLLVLLAFNLIAHFIPLERAGFQQDDYSWLHLARAHPESYVQLALSQPVRPLGYLIYMVLPATLGLQPGIQLALLILGSSVLTALLYQYLAGVFGQRTAALISLFYVLWPVKHEIYSSQLYVTNLTAACLVVVAGLLYRRAVREDSSLSLIAAVFAYGASIFTYEIGFFAPVLFFLLERRDTSRPRNGALLFLIPAMLCWAVRLLIPSSIGTGNHALTLEGLVAGAVSLPSNLIGFQLARNVAYGWWAVWNSPLWFKVFVAVSAVGTGVAARRWSAGRELDEPKSGRFNLALLALGSAVLLIGPTSAVLVESRASVLAGAAMAVVVTTLARARNPVPTMAAAVLLLIASQGLALRQAEISAIQGAMYTEIVEQAAEVRAADRVVFDLSGLMRRAPYTWGDQAGNAFTVYWGMLALTPRALAYMTEDAVLGSEPAARTASRTFAVCGAPVVKATDTLICETNVKRGRAFTFPQQGTLLIGTDSLTLPASIEHGQR